MTELLLFNFGPESRSIIRVARMHDIP
jgi:hypothetical protein